MDDSLATLDELQARLDWTLDEGEQALATGALADLSDDARFYGSARWDSINVPRQAKSLVLRAVGRFMRNPDAFIQSRAGDETVMWTDRGEEAGTAYFTEKEQKMLGLIAGRGAGLISAGVTAYGPTRSRGPRYIDPTKKHLDGFLDDGYVTVYETPSGVVGEIPFFADDEGSI